MLRQGAIISGCVLIFALYSLFTPCPAIALNLCRFEEAQAKQAARNLSATESRLSRQNNRLSDLTLRLDNRRWFYRQRIADAAANIDYVEAVNEARYANCFMRTLFADTRCISSVVASNMLRSSRAHIRLDRSQLALENFERYAANATFRQYQKITAAQEAYAAAQSQHASATAEFERCAKAG